MTTTFDIPTTSRAAVLTKHSEPLEIREIPVPQKLEPNALLVRIEAATVCGSDLHLWDGSLGGSQALDLPVIPGHEMVGRIVAFGDDAEQEDGANPAYVCVRDGVGNVLARMESRHVHGVGVDSQGDIYAGLTQDRSVDKFVRVG